MGIWHRALSDSKGRSESDPGIQRLQHHHLIVGVVALVLMLNRVPYINYIVAVFLAIMFLTHIGANLSNLGSQWIYLLEGLLDLGAAAVLVFEKNVRAFFVNNSGKPKKSKTEWRILFVVLVFWIAVLVKFLLPDGRWQIMRQLQDEYGEAFTICDSHIQKTDSGIYTFYTVSPKENPDVVFIVISGWSKGRWDGLLPIWHFPHKSVRENYKTAPGRLFVRSIKSIRW